MVATSSFILAASSIFSVALSAPVPNTAANSLVERASFSSYAVYGGNGSPSSGWPSQSNWVPFEQAWQNNLKLMSASCTQFPGQPQDNSEQEIKDIKSAIESVSQQSKLPKEFLLAVMMQESKGCVRAPTTNYGVRNPGLFQSFNGQATCGENPVKTPCPSSTITQMVSEGAGIGLQFGLAQAVAQSGASDVSKYYKAARVYNSGSLPKDGNLGQGVATHCYASDIANRLMGWTDQSTSCQEGSVGTMTGSTGGSGNQNGHQDGNEGGNQDQNPAPPSTPTATQNPQPSQASQPTQQPPTTISQQPSAPKVEGAASNCKSWYVVKDDDDCHKMSVPFDTLRKFNSQLDDKCSNLWLGYAYCVEA